MIQDLLNSYFEEYFYLFMFIIPFLAQMGIPIGAMFFILYAGSIATGYLELNNLFFIILAGTLCGDILSYSFARKFSRTNQIKHILKKNKILKIRKKTSRFLHKHGSTSIFITRFLITGIGPYLNYILGIEKFNFKKFSIYILAGEIFYTAEFLLIGFIFKDTFEEILSIFSDFSYILLIMFILYHIVKIIIKVEHRHKLH